MKFASILISQKGHSFGVKGYWHCLNSETMLRCSMVVGLCVEFISPKSYFDINE